MNNRANTTPPNNGFFNFFAFNSEDYGNHQEARSFSAGLAPRIAADDNWIITAYKREDGACKIDVFSRHSELGYAQHFPTTEKTISVAGLMRQDRMANKDLIAAGFTRCSGKVPDTASKEIAEGDLTFKYFDDGAWACFNGAERFPDGTDPQIAETEEFAFLIDYAGDLAKNDENARLGIMMNNGKDVAQYEGIFKTAEAARFFCASLKQSDLTSHRRLCALGLDQVQ